MAKYTRQDILDLIEQEDIEFIRLQFTDISGRLKNMATIRFIRFTTPSKQIFVPGPEAPRLLWPENRWTVLFPLRFADCGLR